MFPFFFFFFKPAYVLVWHPQFIDIGLTMNKSSLQSNINKLTAHVLVSLKMGALCNADTTAMTAWRLFMSHSFWEVSQHMLSCGYDANILGNITPPCCVWVGVPWRCECTDSTPLLWSLTSVHGGSPVPPRNSSRRKKKTKQNTNTGFST